MKLTHLLLKIFAFSFTYNSCSHYHRLTIKHFLDFFKSTFIPSLLEAYFHIIVLVTCFSRRSTSIWAFYSMPNEMEFAKFQYDSQIDVERRENHANMSRTMMWKYAVQKT